MSTEVAVEAPGVPQPEPKMIVRLWARGLNGEFLVPEKHFAELLDWLTEHRAQEVK